MYLSHVDDCTCLVCATVPALVRVRDCTRVVHITLLVLCTTVHATVLVLCTELCSHVHYVVLVFRCTCVVYIMVLILVCNCTPSFTKLYSSHSNLYFGVSSHVGILQAC
jgi:hypothetical protein